MVVKSDVQGCRVYHSVMGRAGRDGGEALAARSLSRYLVVSNSNMDIPEIASFDALVSSHASQGQNSESTLYPSCLSTLA